MPNFHKVSSGITLQVTGKANPPAHFQADKFCKALQKMQPLVAHQVPQTEGITLLFDSNAMQCNAVVLNPGDWVVLAATSSQAAFYYVGKCPTSTVEAAVSFRTGYM